MNMILFLMSLNYDMSLQYICWADHFFYDLFQDVSFLPNLFGLTLIRNQSGLCTHLFILKSATWRAIYVYFMTCSLIINKFRQTFYLFDNPVFLGVFFPLSLSARTFEFELFWYNFFFLMKLFLAQSNLLKHRHDHSVYCNQLFLLPTAYLKRFS